MYQFCSNLNQESNCLSHIMSDVCKSVNCTRSVAIIWEKEVNFSADRTTTLIVEVGTEPVDAIHAFCKENSETTDAAVACRAQVILIVETRNYIIT